MYYLTLIDAHKFHVFSARLSATCQLWYPDEFKYISQFGTAPDSCKVRKMINRLFSMAISNVIMNTKFTEQYDKIHRLEGEINRKPKEISWFIHNFVHQQVCEHRKCLYACLPMHAHMKYKFKKLLQIGGWENKPFPIAETSQPTPLTFRVLLMAVLLLPAH